MEKSEKKKISKKLKKFSTFFVVNASTTIVDYLFYTLMARILGNSDFGLVIATVTGGTIGTIVAYILNNKITWKEADPGKTGVFKFFAWNATKIAAIKPVLTVLYKNLSGLYEFGFSITSAIHLPFDYAFVESTGIFVLVTLTTMMMSYLIYDRLIFKQKKEDGGKKKDMESVRESGEE